MSRKSIIFTLQKRGLEESWNDWLRKKRKKIRNVHNITHVAFEKLTAFGKELLRQVPAHNDGFSLWTAGKPVCEAFMFELIVVSGVGPEMGPICANEIFRRNGGGRCTGSCMEESLEWRKALP